MNGLSSFSRSRHIRVSTILVCGSKLYSHTCSMIIVLETTRPAFRARYSRSVNSSGWISIRVEPRYTLRDKRSIDKSPTVNVEGSAVALARRSSA